MESYIERLQRMTPAELEVEAAKANARYERAQEAKYGRLVDVEINGIKAKKRVWDDMPSDKPEIRKVERKDAAGRTITEFVGNDMSWMNTWKATPLRMVRICKDPQDFSTSGIYK